MRTTIALADFAGLDLGLFLQSPNAPWGGTAASARPSSHADECVIGQICSLSLSLLGTRRQSPDANFHKVANQLCVIHPPLKPYLKCPNLAMRNRAAPRGKHEWPQNSQQTSFANTDVAQQLLHLY